MKRRILSILPAALLSVLPLAASAQDMPAADSAFPKTSSEGHVPLPPSLDGSMMPFDFSICNPGVNLPDSLSPFYAAYVARHGARYLSGPKKIKTLMKALEKGRNSGTLSKTGEAFLSMMERIKTANEDNWGQLSPVGIMEERKLGDRMHDILPLLSDSATRVRAISSYVPRVVMTMYQFNNRLCQLNDKISVATDEGTRFDPLLCCFIADTAYARFRDNGAWKKPYDRFCEANVSTEPARRLFSATSLSNKELRKLTIDMYEVLKGNRAAGLPAPTTQWMTVNEYRQCWRADNLRHYLRNTITSVSRLPGKATSPLLRLIIAQADSCISLSGVKPAAYPALNGYFGHCETLLPLLSLIDLPACALPSNKDFDTLDDCWKIQELSPLGANLLILLARAPSGRIYATLQLNGHTVRPMPGHPDVVAWDILRDHWQRRIDSFQ